MNLGSKLEHRVTLRLTDEQFKFLTDVSTVLGVSPSDYLRMSINAGMVSTRKNLGDYVDGTVLSKMKGMVGTNENVKTNIDNQL